VEVYIHSLLTSALDGGEWSASRPGRFTHRERATGTQWIGGWVGPRAVLDKMVKRKLPTPGRESNPRCEDKTDLKLYETYENIVTLIIIN
jgi:hypothetical protein